MDKNKRQYTVEDSFTNHYSVKRYENGKLCGEQIVPYYELDGCILTLENFGYERAFSVVLCKKLLDEAKEQYEIAKSLYETARNNPLIGETEV